MYKQEDRGKIQKWASHRGSKYVGTELLFYLTYVTSSFVQQFILITISYLQVSHTST